MSSAAAARVDEKTAVPTPVASSRSARLLSRFHEVRDFTTKLSANLAPEDCVVQSMPDVSPTKWHLAHTTWFFETFILKKWIPGYQSENSQYAYLFNSYYNAAGNMHRRDLRGLISRPTVEETHRYRSSIDDHIDNLLSRADEKLFDEIEMHSEGALIDAEILAKATRRAYTIGQVGVHHYPRTAGMQTGANFKVIFRAFKELFKLRKRIRAGR